MICGVCRWIGTRPNKSGLYCNCDQSERTKVRSWEQSCDRFEYNPQLDQLINRSIFLEQHCKSLEDLVWGQCETIIAAERVVLKFARMVKTAQQIVKLAETVCITNAPGVSALNAIKMGEAIEKMRVHLKERKLTYPTQAEIENAEHVDLARWYRFLPSPGHSALGTQDFEKAMEKEKALLDLIMERLNSLGGLTPEISKEIGW